MPLFEDFLLKPGKPGGQSAAGGTGSGDNLTIYSTTHATKGKIILGLAALSAYDEVNNRLGIGTTSPTFKFEVQHSATGAFAAVNTAATSSTGGSGLSGFASGAPASGDRLGFLSFGSLISGTFRTGSIIQTTATEGWTGGTAQGSDIQFRVCTNGSAGTTERMRLNHDGTLSVSIGGVFGAAVGTALTSTFVALEVNSTTKAFLLPRMSATQRDAMTATDGMMIYLASGTGSPAVQGRVGGAWVTL